MHALFSRCGVYRLDRTLVSLGGKDRVRWLNGMVSNNIRDLEPGRGVYAFVLNPQGQIQGDLYVFNRGETLVLEIERAQPGLLAQLRRYIIMDKVEVEELGETVTVLEIAGPTSQQVLASVGINAPDTSVLTASEVRWNGATMTVVRGDNPCVPNFELCVPSGKAEEVWTALTSHGAQAVGAAALEAFRVISGIPKVGADIRERTLPQETGQDRALNFSKGCYIGQEIVERIRARGSVHRTLTGFELSAVLPEGSAIQHEGKEIGVITTVATVPTQSRERVIALGFIRKEQLTDAAQFEVAGVEVRPASLPFSNLIREL